MRRGRVCSLLFRCRSRSTNLRTPGCFHTPCLLAQWSKNNSRSPPISEADRPRIAGIQRMTRPAPRSCSTCKETLQVRHRLVHAPAPVSEFTRPSAATWCSTSASSPRRRSGDLVLEVASSAAPAIGGDLVFEVSELDRAQRSAATWCSRSASSPRPAISGDLVLEEVSELVGSPPTAPSSRSTLPRAAGRRIAGVALLALVVAAISDQLWTTGPAHS